MIKKESAYLEDFWQALLCNLAYLKVSESEKVIALAQRLHNSGLMREKAILFSSIARLSAQLFDLYLFKRIMESV